MSNLLKFGLLPKLRGAVRLLATEKGTLKERLKMVYDMYLLSIRPDDYPKEEKEKLMEIFSELTKKDEEYRGEGKLEATLRRTNVITHSKIADMIFELYEEVSGKV